MAGKDEQPNILADPVPTHSRILDTVSGDEPEATELRDVTAAAQGRRASRILSPQQHDPHWYDPVKKFWRHHVRISVPHDDCRDHLGGWCTGSSLLARIVRRD